MQVSDRAPLRVDAQRNLEAILVAARRAFAEGGLDVGVEEIARSAGVGKATFFRRFPTKDALILAVLEGFATEIEESADRCLAMDDPWEGLRVFIIDNARMQAENHGFFDAMATKYVGASFPLELPQRVMTAMARVLEPAQRAGLVREGVEAGDIKAILGMLGAAVRPVPSLRQSEAEWMRYLELLLSGIRPGQPALPGVPMDPCALMLQAQSLCRR